MLTIHYSDGSSKLGFILGLNGGTLRVAVQEQEDAEIFQLHDGLWRSEAGQDVTFVFGLEMEDAARLMPHLEELQVQSRPSRCAAGGDCVFRTLVTKPAN